MTSNSTTNQIKKFQELECDETYTVVNFTEIHNMFGMSYILDVLKNGVDDIIKVWSLNQINEYIETKKLKEHPIEFKFTVRRISEGKFAGKLCAEIDGFEPNQVIKFQELECDKTYTVVELKGIDGKFGRSYILVVQKKGDDDKIKVWASKQINKYIETKKLEEHPTKFKFTVVRISGGDFAGLLRGKIDGLKENSGFIQLV